MKATHERYRSWYKVGWTAAAERYSRVPVLHYIIHLDVSCKEHLVTFEFVYRDIKETHTRTHRTAKSHMTHTKPIAVARAHQMKKEKRKKNAHSEPKRICCYVSLTFVKCLICTGADKTVHSLANNFWFCFSHFKCWALKGSFSFPLCK